MSNKSIKPLAIALGATFVTSLAGTSVANAAENPFSMTELSSGYMVAAEGKCGEGKCGEGMKDSAEGKCGEGKCGEGMKGAAEGKCGEGKCGEAMKDKAEEGKCGEGKCGGNK
jgi:uncharacterized low-complexity protein